MRQLCDGDSWPFRKGIQATFLLTPFSMLICVFTPFSHLETVSILDRSTSAAAHRKLKAGDSPHDISYVRGVYRLRVRQIL